METQVSWRPLVFKTAKHVLSGRTLRVPPRLRRSAPTNPPSPVMDAMHWCDTMPWY